MNDERLSTDQLRWLLASLALVYGLHALHLPLWMTLLALLAGSWRYAAQLGKIRLPRLRTLLPLAAVAIAGVALSHGVLFGRDASVSLLATMMALKLLESRSRRDAMLLVFLAFFFCITGFLFSQSLLVSLYLLLPLVALTATLIAVNHPYGTMPARARLRLAGMMLAQGAPIMLVLFLLFPRIEGPLWGVPEDAYSGMIGLSDRMAPGSISQLSRSDSIAFRAVFQGAIPDLARLYWRGPVLWAFDGTTWTSEVQPGERPSSAPGATGPLVRYTVTLEPHNRRWLFMLDLPVGIPPGSTLTHDYQLLAKQPVRLRMRYDGASQLDYRLNDRLDPESRSRSLQLPERGNPKALALGRQWAGDSPIAVVQRALDLFREQPFRYTLNPPLLGEHPVDEFLFSTRSGFCEHYASSFVFLMRAAGVPARVVTGYQGGEINPADHYLMVRQADAHAWAEVWLERQGWVRIDPTAAVSPQRVESGIATALPAGEPVPPLMRADLQWLRQFYLRWDAVNNRWNQWVLGYDQRHQAELLARLAGSQIDWQDMIVGLVAGMAAVALAISAFVLLHGRRRVDALQAEYLRFVRRLASAGVERQPHEGPLDFAARAAEALPGKAEEIREISLHYARLRYGLIAPAHQIVAFRQQVRAFRP